VLYEDWATYEAGQIPLPIPTLRPRGFCVLQSVSLQDLGSSSWLASSPFALPSQRALGSSVYGGAADELTIAAILSGTSTPPRRVHLTRAAILLTSYVDRKPLSNSTSRKLRGPTAYPETGTHFCADPFEPAFRKRCPALGKSRRRVWLPSWRVDQPQLPWRPLSASNAHGLRPSELCLLPGDQHGVTTALSAPALSHKTSRPRIGATAAWSHPESRPPWCHPKD